MANNKNQTNKPDQYGEAGKDRASKQQFDDIDQKLPVQRDDNNAGKNTASTEPGLNQDKLKTNDPQPLD